MITFSILTILSVIIILAVILKRKAINRRELTLFRESLKQGQRINVKINDFCIVMIICRISDTGITCKEFHSDRLRLIPIQFIYPL